MRQPLPSACCRDATLFRRTLSAVSYLLRYDTDTAGRLVVTMTPPPQSGAVQLVFPRSIPMGYGVAPYADFIEGVRAWSPSGEQLPVARLEGPRWQIGRDGVVLQRLRYVVNVHRMEQQTLAASDSSALALRVCEPARLFGPRLSRWPRAAAGQARRAGAGGLAGLRDPRTCRYAMAGAGHAQRTGLLRGRRQPDPSIGTDFQVRQLAGVRPLFLVGYVEAPADLAIDGSLMEQAFGASRTGSPAHPSRTTPRWSSISGRSPASTSTDSAWSTCRAAPISSSPRARCSPTHQPDALGTCTVQLRAPHRARVDPQAALG